MFFKPQYERLAADGEVRHTHTGTAYRGKAEANYTHTKHCESEKHHNSAQRLFKMRQEQNKLVKEEQQDKKMKR